MATDLTGAGLTALLKAERAGLVILQKTGVAPLGTVGAIGNIALDTKSHTAYYKSGATTWVAFTGVTV